MADLIRFVDSVSASATTRLDLNDDTAVLHVREVQWNPPRLRRSVSQNMLRDGGHVGPSSYDLRTLVLSFDVIASDVDTLATHLQALTRELDRETNWLMYQPTGATHPVFFKTYRSDLSSLVDIPAAVAFRQLVVEVLTDPLAVGARQSMSTTTVTNDPAAGTNGMYLECDTVIGDVPAPAVITFSHLSPLTTFESLFLATRRDALSLADVNYEQLATGYTDTTNPGGAADSAMSGTGSTNYLRTSFATTTAMADRVAFSETMPRGSYRMLAVVRRSDGTSVMRARFVRTTSGGTALETGLEVTIPQTTNRQILDLGLFSFGRGDLDTVGHSTDPADETLACFGRGQAQRISGSGTLDWDLLIALPTAAEVTLAAPTGSGTGATAGLVVDAVQQQVVPYVPGGDPFAGTADANGPAWSVSGGFPMLHPTTPNRLVIAWTRSAGHVVTDTMSVRVHYWPRYLHLRPVST